MALRIGRASIVASLCLLPVAAMADAAAPAHPAVTGRLGPFAAARVTLRPADPVTGNGFRGSVAAAGRSYRLPDNDEPPEFFQVRVRAVMFADADRRPGNELLVLYAAQKRAPGEDSHDAVDVFRWNGHGFERLRAVEARLEGSRSAAQVRARLRRAR